MFPGVGSVCQLSTKNPEFRLESILTLEKPRKIDVTNSSKTACLHPLLLQSQQKSALLVGQGFRVDSIQVRFDVTNSRNNCVFDWPRVANSTNKFGLGLHTRDKECAGLVGQSFDIKDPTKTRFKIRISTNPLRVRSSTEV